MYGGFDVFKTYLAVKLHFTSDKYNYIQYDGKVNCKLDTFTKRNDRYFFHKLSKKYKESEILDFFVANFLSNQKKWVGSLLENDGKDTYISYKKFNESFKYHFRNDCSTIHSDLISNNIVFDDGFRAIEGQHPRVLKLLIRKKISYQTIVAMDKILGFIKKWDKEISERVVWKDLSFRIKKFGAFVKFNDTECKLIMKEVFIND